MLAVQKTVTQCAHQGRHQVWRAPSGGRNELGHNPRVQVEVSAATTYVFHKRTAKHFAVTRMYPYQQIFNANSSTPAL